MKSRNIAALVLALALPIAAHADDASQHAKAQELITLLHSDRMVSQVSSNLLKQVTDAALQVTGSNPTAESTARMQEFDKKASAMIDAQLGWSVMGPEIVNIYAKAFTEEELTAILNFYKSPAGTAFLSKGQDINNQINDVAKPRMAALQSQLGQAFSDFRKEQTASTPPTLQTLPPAGGSTPAAGSSTTPKAAAPTTPKPATPATR